MAPRLHDSLPGGRPVARLAPKWPAGCTTCSQMASRLHGLGPTRPAQDAIDPDNDAPAAHRRPSRSPAPCRTWCSLRPVRTSTPARSRNAGTSPLAPIVAIGSPPTRPGNRERCEKLKSERNRRMQQITLAGFQAEGARTALPYLYWLSCLRKKSKRGGSSWMRWAPASISIAEHSSSLESKS